MLFFILVVAAVISIAVYVAKKTKSSSHTIPTTPPPVYTPEEQPSTPWNVPNVEVVTPPKFEVSDEAEPIVATDAPKMDAKPKKKLQPKKKPATKANA